MKFLDFVLLAGLAMAVMANAQNPLSSNSGPGFYWRGSAPGQLLECDIGDALIGVCSSRSGFDCALPEGGNPFIHLILCGTKPKAGFNWYETKGLEPLDGDFNEYVDCNREVTDDTFKFAVGRCASGRDRDCEGSAHQLRCATLPVPTLEQTVQLDTTDKFDICASFGELAVCPEGYVVTQSCGASDIGSDCRVDLCSAHQGDVFSGIRCLKLDGFEYGGVQGGEHLQKTSVSRIVIDCSIKTYEPVVDLMLSNTATVTETTELQSTRTTSTTSSSQVVTSVGVENKIRAEVGIPRVGSASVETTLTAGLDTTVSFEKSEMYFNSLTTQISEMSERSWRVVLTAGPSYAIASWGVRLSPSAEYLIGFNRYQPREADSVVTEGIEITATVLSNQVFFVVLSSDDYSRSLINAPCDKVANQYMNGAGDRPSFTSIGTGAVLDGTLNGSGALDNALDSDDETSSAALDQQSFVLFYGTLLSSVIFAAFALLN
jgi:hypothetical protein